MEMEPTRTGLMRRAGQTRIRMKENELGNTLNIQTLYYREELSDGDQDVWSSVRIEL